MLQLQLMLAQRRDQGVGGGHRVLNRQVDAHAADRRHGVRGVADAQHPRFGPAIQTIDANAQQFDLIPLDDLLQAIVLERRHLGEVQ
ncbi:Uncharacterised protein [Acinetobacter baumannii]|nr:Uncharacterised protein [Acinetobacter baumannii]